MEARRLDYGKVLLFATILTILVQIQSVLESILGAIAMDISSWNRSLQAYGMQTSTALEELLVKIGYGNYAASSTHVNFVCITLVKKPFFEEVRSTMSYHTVSLHFTDPKTTITRTPFHRLPSQDLHWSTCTRVDLVIHHMLQPLVIGRSHEYHCRKFSS